MKKYQYTSSTCLLTSLLLLPVAFDSCKKFLSIKPPVDQVISTEVFQNDKSASAAMAGLYSRMMQNETIFSFYMTAKGGLLADELTNNTPADPFVTNTLLPSTPEIDTYWTQCYSFIYLANSIIEGVNHSTGLSAAVKNQLIGEATFIRAFVNFYLVNAWGDAPLENSTDYRANASIGRTRASVVYEQVVADLLNAQSLLVTDYPAAEKNRANKWAATALLARVYLYLSEWGKAEAQASAVINSAIYLPLPSPEGAFLKNNTEAIWQFSPVDPSYNTFDGKYFIEATHTALPGYQVTGVLQNAFEPGDLRKMNWLDSSVFAGATYYFPYKYKEPADAGPAEYYTVLRLAEQFLIRAEARTNQNNLAGAIEDLNIIRARAGLPALPASLSKDQLALAIAQERRVELFCEFGHRWFDLKRTGKADAVLGNLKPTWKPSSVLWPVPANQIQLNSALTQNPGY